jgi:hypothetical protein
MMSNSNYFDTSSLSSSSRESSVHSGTPTSSANTVRAGAASNSFSTRAKRGSESQGSSSGRDRKRRSVSSNSGNQSEDVCDTCKTLFRDCSAPKEDERKSRKIVKEKASREKQAQVLQKIEDLNENAYDLTQLKLQMPGNQKKSGLERDKQEILEVTFLVLDMQMQTMASNLSLEVMEKHRKEANDAILERVVKKESEGLYDGGLLASQSGNLACVHESRGLECKVPITCRKAEHRRNHDNNMARMLGSGITATTPTPAGAVLSIHSSRPASTQRRNHSNL